MATEPIPDEDKDLRSILEMNLDGLDTLGLEDNSFRAAPPPAPVTLEQRMAASPRLKRLQAQWEKGETGDSPSGLPLNRSISQLEPAERTLTYKATVVKTWDASVQQTKEVYDLVCL